MTVKILGPVFWMFAAFACAGGSGTGVPTSSVRPMEKEKVSVEVQNQNFYQATVYAYRAGNRARLGVVESQSTRSFEFVWITGDLRFLIDFFANGCILSEPVAVDRGEEVLLILEPQDYRRASQALCRA